jgi:hypothetical protein
MPLEMKTRAAAAGRHLVESGGESPGFLGSAGGPLPRGRSGQRSGPAASFGAFVLPVSGGVPFEWSPTRAWRMRESPLIIENMSGDNDFRTRATGRATWPVRRFRLGSEPSDDLSALSTPEERLEMMWPLTLEAWSLAGRPIPEYRRDATPVHCLRLAAR